MADGKKYGEYSLLVTDEEIQRAAAALGVKGPVDSGSVYIDRPGLPCLSQVLRETSGIPALEELVAERAVLDELEPRLEYLLDVVRIRRAVLGAKIADVKANLGLANLPPRVDESILPIKKFHTPTYRMIKLLDPNPLETEAIMREKFPRTIS